MNAHHVGSRDGISFFLLFLPKLILRDAAAVVSEDDIVSLSILTPLQKLFDLGVRALKLILFLSYGRLCFGFTFFELFALQRCFFIFLDVVETPKAAVTLIALADAAETLLTNTTLVVVEEIGVLFGD